MNHHQTELLKPEHLAPRLRWKNSSSSCPLGQSRFLSGKDGNLTLATLYSKPRLTRRRFLQDLHRFLLATPLVLAALGLLPNQFRAMLNTTWKPFFVTFSMTSTPSSLFLTTRATPRTNPVSAGMDNRSFVQLGGHVSPWPHDRQRHHLHPISLSVAFWPASGVIALSRQSRQV